jgi:RNA recognition motif. (a.k.a. RRM, RBD, or RNP domain)
MGDQSDLPKKDEQPGPPSISEFNQALPAGSVYSSQQHYPAASLLQYVSPPSYSPGQYQQLYLVARSQGAYNSGQTEQPQYYPYSVGQQQVDASQGGYGYRNSPVASAVTGHQFATAMPRTAQSGQTQQYQIPPFQYQLPPQPYQLPLGRATSFPAYSSQTRSPAQSIQQNSPYPVFSPPFLQNVPPTFSEEPASISSDPENFLPRGPPRKPKQSGFALWVGNLPRDVRLEELKDFFAIEGLESIFLIRKSNCAFVNYKKEEDCAKALSTFNDKSTISVVWLLMI